MAFIPKDARWYLADIVLEFVIEEEPRNVVHINTHLVEAGSPDEAYDKAVALGREAEDVYQNSDNKRVEAIFRGLASLNVIHEELEDGAEIIYREKIGVPPERFATFIPPKEELGVFAPILPCDANAPNYTDRSVWKMLLESGFSGNFCSPDNGE